MPAAKETSIRQDPFQVLGTVEVGLIISFLPLVSTETLRELCSVWCDTIFEEALDRILGFVDWMSVSALEAQD